MLTCGADGKIQGFDPFRVGLAFGAFASNVTFGDGIHPYIERESASASFEWHPEPRHDPLVGRGREPRRADDFR